MWLPVILVITSNPSRDSSDFTSSECCWGVAIYTCERRQLLCYLVCLDNLLRLIQLKAILGAELGCSSLSCFSLFCLSFFSTSDLVKHHLHLQNGSVRLVEECTFQRLLLEHNS